MSIPRKIFYSFRFDDDVMRVQQIRNIGVIEDNKPVTPNKWEEIKRGGDLAIRKWIDSNISRSECVVVLIGENTYKSKWVDYEIKKAWADGKGLVGIYIHNLKDPKYGVSNKGKDPFEEINYKVVARDNFSVYMDCLDDKEEINLKNGKKLSEYISVYNPDSDAYNWIAKYINQIVEKGMQSKK